MKQYILLLLMGCIAAVSAAQQPAGRLTICGHWKDYSPPALHEAGNHLPAVIVYEKHLRGDANNHQQVYELDIRQDSFYLSVPLTKDVQYVRFAYIGNRLEEQMPFNQPLLVQPGDSVHFSVRGDCPIGFRTNNTLIDLQFELANVACELFDLALGYDIVTHLGPGIAEVQRRFSSADSIIGRFAHQPDSYLFSLCRFNFRYQVLAALCQRFNADAYFGEPETLSDTALHNLIEAFRPYQSVPDPRYVIESVSYLLFQHYLHTAIGVITARLSGYDREDHLQFAEYGYTGILRIPDAYTRDHTIDLYFKRSKEFRMTGKSGIPLLIEAMSVVQTPAVKAELDQRLASLRGGQPVPDFTFLDETGNEVSLTDFRGKVVVAHFWFLGCRHCIPLAEALRPLVERYAADGEIVFLNINVDREHGKWLAGLQDGVYHHVQERSLHTGPVGMSHPMLQYFEFFSVPELVVIDQEGILVSKRPERRSDTPETVVLDRLVSGLIAR